MSELISIIVPIYNSEKYIEKCVNSILAQTYREIEVILIDDGSSDRSASICDEYKRLDERVKVLHKNNEGLINARKDGFRMSHGKWIAFVDSDDWIDENMIESLLTMAEIDSADVVISSVIDEYNGNSNKRKNQVATGCYFGKELEEIKNKLFGGNEYFSFIVLPYLWNKLWKRELMKDNLMLADESIKVGEDVIIGFPAIMQANCISVIDDAYYHYCRTPNSMLMNRKDQLAEFKNAEIIYNYLRNRIKSIAQLDSIEEGVRRLYINLILTRAYECVSQIVNRFSLFPFIEKEHSDIIIYGAGSFGIAVYNYAKERFCVKAWVDINAAFLQSIGYPVVSPDEMIVNENDLVVVPIFEMKSAKSVKECLIDRGVREENIALFNMSEELEQELVALMWQDF